MNFEENHVFSVISRQILFLLTKLRFLKNVKFGFLMNVYQLCFHQKEHVSKNEKGVFLEISLLSGHRISEKRGFSAMNLLFSQW